ncbi:MAG: cupin-like domain-containing protein [Colwellia sp.]|nr:cupin-like domain-containing protein [Colwellia sp.]MCW8864308.1 cupin-like domain-containing protein [Colwellia sp.]MCW9082662.1 cupin-like domain-containing protein [Colwellia sp.]
MNIPLKQVSTWHDVNREIFERDIVPRYEPAILKNHVAKWPSVISAKQSEKSICDYLTKQYAGGNVRFARLAAKHHGIFSYNEDITGFNFTREVGPLGVFLAEVYNNSKQKGSDTLALQSALISDYFPQFSQDNTLELFDKKASPRIWIGNDAVVSAHFDDAENIACVVSGKRRFTLFPPNQIDNLYAGPIDFTPAGAQVSLVDFSNPDFAKFPKFRNALSHALVAELEPGDALYLPSLWWHHVQAYGGVNILVNYWCGGSIASRAKPAPLDAMLMAILAIRELPQDQKNAWQDFFNYYIFSQQNEKNAHIPEHALGILGNLSSKHHKDLRNWLITQLK